MPILIDDEDDIRFTGDFHETITEKEIAITYFKETKSVDLLIITDRIMETRLDNVTYLNQLIVSLYLDYRVIPMITYGKD
jgi:hypothetical protein